MAQHESRHYDIAIIGGGVTGLSAAFHLQSSTKLRLCLADARSQASSSELSANLAVAGLVDNFTRTEQRHGSRVASEVWRYSQTAFDELQAFASAHGIRFQQGKRLRLIESQDEVEESRKAVELLNANGFESTFEPAPSSVSSPFLAQQNDRIGAAWIDHDALIQKLKDLTRAVSHVGAVSQLTQKEGVFHLETPDGRVTAEMVILACHLHIPDFIPSMKAVLVSTQDQWMRYETEGEDLPYPLGSVLTWKHGHYWAHIESPRQIVLGGARFLRPLAGFEAKEAELSDRVGAHLKEYWNKHFPKHPIKNLVASQATLDIRPCDEIPVIGPMFGESGLLFAAGYMGQGLSLGFKAGQSLAKIVLGEKNDLPRFFWPERHRSLASTDEGN